jgi:tRNA(Ile2) C34 agmatinyltransferase TiaS
MYKYKPKKYKQFKIPHINTVCPKCKSVALTVGKEKDFKCRKCYFEFDQGETKD